MRLSILLIESHVTLTRKMHSAQFVSFKANPLAVAYIKDLLFSPPLPSPYYSLITPCACFHDLEAFKITLSLAQMINLNMASHVDFLLPLGGVCGAVSFN